MRFRTVSETESAGEDARLLKMIFRNAITVVTPTSAKPVTMVLDMREQSIARDAQCRAATRTFEVAASGDVTTRRLAPMRCLLKTSYILAPLTLSTTSV